MIVYQVVKDFIYYYFYMYIIYIQKKFLVFLSKTDLFINIIQ